MPVRYKPLGDTHACEIHDYESLRIDLSRLDSFWQNNYAAGC